MFLLIGLGNPGAEYENHRHNAGFMALDAIAREYGFPSWRRRFASLIAEGAVGSEKVLALKPQTYMNLSGQAVAVVADFYKIPPARMIVFHDDLDLVPGHIRVKKGGGAGGHNGLKSLDELLGPDYWRVRIGIGRPTHKAQVSSYVLSDFAQEEYAWLTPLLANAARFLPQLLAGQGEAYAKACLHPP